MIEREIDNPATDQSSVEYIYEELVSQTEDSVGTIYLINDITELDFDIQGDYSDIIIFEESFQCESRSVCEELRDSYTTDKKIQLEFKYLGNGIIALNRFYYK